MGYYGGTLLQYHTIPYNQETTLVTNCSGLRARTSGKSCAAKAGTEGGDSAPTDSSPPMWAAMVPFQIGRWLVEQTCWMLIDVDRCWLLDLGTCCKGSAQQGWPGDPLHPIAHTARQQSEGLKSPKLGVLFQQQTGFGGESHTVSRIALGHGVMDDDCWLPFVCHCLPSAWWLALFETPWWRCVCVCSAKSCCISGGRTSPPKPGSRGVYHVYHHVMQRTCDPLVLGMHRRTCLESEDLWIRSQ